LGDLVFIKEICPWSWLHWSSKGEKSCLRDFTRPEIRKYNTSKIKEYLQNEGNKREKAANRRVTGYENRSYWLKEIERRNSDDGPSSGADADTPRVADRMLDLFKREVAPLLEQKDITGLERVFAAWMERLSCIKKKHWFNRWDDDEASAFPIRWGAGWTKKMLEFSRQAGVFTFIKTGGDEKSSMDIDFSLLAHALKLGISSTNNLVQPSETDYVELDGFGMKRDGSCCVLEVKGPEDSEDSLYEATLQALLGALAVYAKREMIEEIARKAQKRRPAATNLEIPAQKRSLGLYIMVAKTNLEGRRKYVWYERLVEQADLLLRACKVLREIVYFELVLDSFVNISALPADRVIRCNAVDSPANQPLLK
jgi:hypothetical protein